MGEIPMNTAEQLIPGILAIRPFLPAKDFAESLSFYEAIGFEAYKLRALWHFCRGYKAGRRRCLTHGRG